jgi:hypothetical protein
MHVNVLKSPFPQFIRSDAVNRSSLDRYFCIDTLLSVIEVSKLPFKKAPLFPVPAN